MNELVRIGAAAGVIGFVAVVVFILCWVAAIAGIGLVGWIVRMIGGMSDENHDTHTD